MGTALLALQIASYVFSMLPQLIQAAELAFGHVRGSGAAKKQVVMDSVRVGLEVANQVNGKPVLDEKMQAVIIDTAGGLVDTVVSVAKAAGLMRAPEAPAP
ncbi:MAG TPA: hypothetical protein VGM22_24300 [Methylomirabilota bacterium]|jgi:MinD superfamily P-loop ATPase